MVRIAWNLGRGGAKKVPGTVPSGKPPESEPYRGKEHWNQWSLALTLLQLEQTTGLSGRRRTGPLTEPGFAQGFFLRSVTDGVWVSLACLVMNTSSPAISLT